MSDRTRHLFAPALRYFAAVARHGSFRAAARELNVASSAVNRQILGLEADLGVALFERIGRRIRLSPSGELLLRHVTDTFRDFEAVAGEIDALKGIRRGRVSIATVESVAQDLLPDIVDRFLTLHPGIDVAVVTTVSEEATRLVTAGEVDLGLTFNPNGGRALEIGLRRVMRIGAVVARRIRSRRWRACASPTACAIRWRCRPRACRYAPPSTPPPPSAAARRGWRWRPTR